MNHLLLKPLILILFVAAALSAEERKQKVAVMELEDKNGIFAAASLEAATEILRSSLNTAGRYIIIDKSRQAAEITKVVKELKKESWKECNDSNCRIQLGQALSADTMLRTSIAALGGTFSLTAELVDLAKEAVVKSEIINFEGSEQGLRKALEELAVRLSGGRAAFTEGKTGEKFKPWEVGGGNLTVVYFTSDPEKASVLLDGAFACSTPCSKMLSEGQHEVVMAADYHVEKREKIQVRKTERKNEITWKLTPDYGWVTIQSTFAGVEVQLDGTLIGKTPITKYKVSRGPHEVTINNSCFLKAGENIVVERGQVKEVFLELKNREAGLEIYAKDEADNDIDAEVFLDKNSLGRTPLKTKVPLCAQQLEIVKEGKESMVQQVSFTEQEIKRFDVLLKSPRVPVTITTEPAGARVTIDGNYLCETPCRDILVHAGERSLRLEKENYEPVKETVKITENSTLDRTLKYHEKKYTYPLKWYSVGAFGTAAALLIPAIYFTADASKVQDNAQAAYDRYKNAVTNEAAAGYWADYTKNRDRYNSELLARNILYGLSAGFAVTGALLFIYRKEIMEDFTVYVDPNRQLVGVIVRY